MAFDALVVLHAIRDAPPRTREREDAFRALDRWLRSTYGTGADVRDLVRQAVLIRVSRAIATLRAETPRQAEAWLRRVHRHVAIDEARSRSRSARRFDSADAEGAPPLVAETVDPAEPTRELRAAVLADFEGRVLDAVGAHLAATVPDPVKRTGDRLRARAALLRLVHRLDVPAIAAELAPEHPGINETLLYKWIERGREVVLAALAAHPDLAQEPGTTELHAILSERRADAGLPRPERRTASRQSADAPDVLVTGAQSPKSHPRPRKPPR